MIRLFREARLQPAHASKAEGAGQKSRAARSQLLHAEELGDACFIALKNCQPGPGGLIFQNDEIAKKKISGNWRRGWPVRMLFRG
jgi:hypothetical protein